MPLFDWSEPSPSQVSSSHLWIYWAVTGPLTFTIMAGVIAWALWHNRHVQLLQSRARESVVTETTGDKVQNTDEAPEGEAKPVVISTSERAIDNKHSLFNILGPPTPLLWFRRC